MKRMLTSVGFGFCLFAADPDLLFATSSISQTLPPEIQAPGSYPQSLLISEEFRYKLPEASEVLLVWGINGWQVVPEEQRPAGTVVEKKVMHTPMARKGDIFTTKVNIPAGTTVDYGFLITSTRSRIWDADGTQDYHTTIRQAGVIEVRGSPSAVNQIAGKGVQSAWHGYLLLIGCGIIGGAFVLSRHVLTITSDSIPFLIDLQNVIWRKRILLITIITSVLYLAAINPDLYLWDDNVHYIIVGKSLASGQGFKDIHLPDKPLFNMPIPMLPLFLAPIIYFFDYNLWPMKIVVALMGISVVYLTYRVFKRLLDETYVLLLMLLVAVSPQIVSFSHQVMTEIPYLCLFLLAVISLTRYGAEQEWLTRTGLISGIVVAAACLTRSTGIALMSAAIPYLLWDSSTGKIQAAKKIALLIVVSSTVWLLFNYHLLMDNFYLDYISRASPFSPQRAGFSDFVTRIGTNLEIYFKLLPETVLYFTYKRHVEIFTLLCGFVVGCGFLYCLFKKRTLIEYYLCFYGLLLLIFPFLNLGNFQRYLVPIIPLILYYFIQGLNQITVRLSDLGNSMLDYSRIDNPAAPREGAFRAARTLSVTVICTLIVFNFIATARASLLRTDAEMFDYYNDSHRAFKTMALWTKEHTEPDSTILNRSIYEYHFWSHRTVNWYPYVNLQSHKEQVIQVLLAQGANYIALDTLWLSASQLIDQSIMDVVQQNPDYFQLVYQDGEDKLYRIILRGTASRQKLGDEL